MGNKNYISSGGDLSVSLHAVYEMSHWIIHSADLLKNTKLIPEQNICQSWQVIEWFIQEAKFGTKFV